MKPSGWCFFVRSSTLKKEDFLEQKKKYNEPEKSLMIHFLRELCALCGENCTILGGIFASS